MFRMVEALVAVIPSQDALKWRLADLGSTCFMSKKSVFASLSH